MLHTIGARRELYEKIVHLTAGVAQRQSALITGSGKKVCRWFDSTHHAPEERR